MDYFKYVGIDGQDMVVCYQNTINGFTVTVSDDCHDAATFTADQYTGFIQREFIRLVESGAIPKPPIFPRNCPECGEISVELHAEGCRYAR